MLNDGVRINIGCFDGLLVISLNTIRRENLALQLHLQFP